MEARRRGMLTGVAGKSTRRAFLGMAAAGALGAAGAAAGCTPSAPGPRRQPPPAAPKASPKRKVVPENSLAGDPHWEVRHPGAPHAIEGYAGKASVLAGETFPLVVSTTSRGLRVTAFRLGW